MRELKHLRSHGAQWLAPLTIALGLAGCRAGCAEAAPADPPARGTAPEAGTAAPGSVKAARPHNIIILSVDTLRADHMGAYGYTSPTTPHMDQLAAEGVLFERAFAARGHTWPSLTTMLTGLYPVRHGVRAPGELLAEGIPTMASLLAAAGYESAAFLANFCRVGQSVFKDGYCRVNDDEGVATKAITWLSQPRDKPFLLWVHLMKPHVHYRPAKRFDRFTDPGYAGPFDGSKSSVHRIYAQQLPLPPTDLDHILGLYDGDVLWADHYIGRLSRAIAARGLDQSSVIVLTSDHGEDLHQHFKFFEHGCSIYDSSLHVPLVLRLPGAASGGQRRGAPVGLVDLLPTLLELTGVQAPSGIDGVSFAPMLEREPEQERPAVLSEHYRELQEGLLLSARSARWRYIYNPSRARPYCLPATQHYAVGEEELYDHEVDPGEQHNVVSEHPAVARALREELLRRYPLDRQPRQAEKAADERTLETLRSLGYLGE